MNLTDVLACGTALAVMAAAATVAIKKYAAKNAQIPARISSETGSPPYFTGRTTRG